MPYQWTTNASLRSQTLTLWPHQSLPARGMAIFVLATFAMISLPLFALLGTALLWGLLPFLLIAVGGIWFALGKSARDRSILETLTIEPTQTSLLRNNPGGEILEWKCNSYWVKPVLHPSGGPVPHYVCLTGNGRDVEIGAFLSEEERQALFMDLQSAFSKLRAAP